MAPCDRHPAPSVCQPPGTCAHPEARADPGRCLYPRARRKGATGQKGTLQGPAVRLPNATVRPKGWWQRDTAPGTSPRLPAHPTRGRPERQGTRDRLGGRAASRSRRVLCAPSCPELQRVSALGVRETGPEVRRSSHHDGALESQCQRSPCSGQTEGDKSLTQRRSRLQQDARHRDRPPRRASSWRLCRPRPCPLTVPGAGPRLALPPDAHPHGGRERCEDKPPPQSPSRRHRTR